MRAVAAIIAAVMSVTTGGSLRCPCQLAFLFRAGSCDTSACVEASPPTAEKQTCSCEARHEPEQPDPAEPKPGPAKPPCPHGPGIDLIQPAAGGERIGGSDVTGGLAMAPPCASAAGCHARGHQEAPPPDPARRWPTPDRLRYCHSFRC